ncbi:hypothetical protein QZH41_006562 [Actinostola sp. cb2023]|nr:hypothetical protein QZH41_006562 [Actinostola sp. cb2023]
MLHSVNYKDAATNDLVGKKVVVVGIGNSAVDVAVNAAELGGIKPVCISTRSGAWIVPNYVAGYPTDHYACRAFLWLPWQLSSLVFGWICRCVLGSPWKWGLNPKMGALQTQLTVSPTLIHHIQRGNIHIKPNVARLESKRVVFTNGSSVEADAIVCCTGYSISLPFLSDKIKPLVIDEGTNKMNLFKSVFSPELGSSLAFIGFIQPASGGLLPVSEIQARWFSALCKGITTLPSKEDMFEEIHQLHCYNNKRYYPSARHTIQQDPILYIDDVASYFGARPQLWRSPTLAWNLLVGTCGAAQWRLQGPHKWNQAKIVVKKVGITPMMQCFGIIVLMLPAVIVAFTLCKIWCD